MERDIDETGDSDQESHVAAARRSMDRRAQYVEVRIQQAMRNGEFDDLPGAGKPIENLGEVHDPDWWIRRKIQRENITGLGPPALTLRTEDAALDARLDAIVSEREGARRSTTSTAGSSRPGVSCWAVPRWSRPSETSTPRSSAGANAAERDAASSRAALRCCGAPPRTPPATRVRTAAAA